MDVKDGFIPAGHWVPKDATPLHRLVMRNLAAAYIGVPGPERKTLGEWIRGLHPDGHDGGDLSALAEHAIESMPAEVTILQGGCGGEPTAACWTQEGYDEAYKKFVEFWDDRDPLWPIVQRIPLVKR